MNEELQNPQPDDSASRRRRKPIANAGSDIVITLPTNQAKLDGSKSKDTLGVIKNYLWQQVAGPSPSFLSSPTDVITNANELIEGAYTFRLKVTNDRNVSDYDDVIVTINKSLIEQVTQPTTTTATPLFTGIMNNGSITTYGGGSTIQPWYSDIQKLGYPEFGFDPSDQFRKIEMVTDNGLKVLHAEIIANDPNDAGRFQAATYLPSKDLGIYHHTQRIKFGADVANIQTYSGAINSRSGSSWFTVFETWMKGNQYRMNVGFNKLSGVNQPIRWEIGAENTSGWQEIWPTQINSSVPVPFGKWFTMDVLIKSGEGSNGQFKVIITVDGESPVVLFDVKNTTTVPGNSSILRNKIDNMKFYMGDALVDLMLGTNKKLEVFYGDYKIFKD